MKRDLGDFVLLDASCPQGVAAGTLDATGRAWKCFEIDRRPALEGLFAAVASAAPGFGGNGFLFCEGPGSILGIRIAAMAIRAAAVLRERPVLAFQSLSLAARLILRAGLNAGGNAPFAVVAESRMNCWNVLAADENGVPAEHFLELKTEELSALPEQVFVLPQRRAVFPLAGTPIDPLELLRADPAVFADCPELLRDCGALPDAINTASAATYAKWTPGRHRGA
ncbi:MAG: hypothetical protein K6B46_01440 [Opitutales bacterium]|nr:hypothetical protein [Opitutales bacterium]